MESHGNACNISAMQEFEMRTGWGALNCCMCSDENVLCFGQKNIGFERKIDVLIKNGTLSTRNVYVLAKNMMNTEETNEH